MTQGHGLPLTGAIFPFCCLGTQVCKPDSQDFIPTFVGTKKHAEKRGPKRDRRQCSILLLFPGNERPNDSSANMA